MTNTEIIKKLRNEITELNQKITNLAVFIRTKKYQDLDILQQKLLREQHQHMSEYYKVLILRIALLQDYVDAGDK